MLKYCNGCKRDLETDNFYSYKKSICKQCVNKKVKCDYCAKEFNNTNLSKHTKQVHSTLQRSDTTDSSSKRTNKSDSTSNISDKSNSTSEITLSDQLNVSTYVDSLKNRNNSYDIKDIDKINKILASNTILNDKRTKDTINEKGKRLFANNLKKLNDLNFFDEKLCNILLKSIH